VSDYIPVAEAAKLLGLTHQQVLNRIHRKTIKAQKFGWFWMVNKKDLKKDNK
jgi:excisionase family DNA binding protein